MADSTPHTLTALFRDQAAAERAAERLHAIGVPDHRIEQFPADGGDVRPGDHIVAGGLLGSLSNLLTPDVERHSQAGLSTILVANCVPTDRLEAARTALGEEAVEVDDHGPDK